MAIEPRPVTANSPSRENRGLDALMNQKISLQTEIKPPEKKEILEVEMEVPQPSILSKIGEGMKKLIGTGVTQEAKQTVLSPPEDDHAAAKTVAAAKMLEGTEATAAQILQESPSDVREPAIDELQGQILQGVAQQQAASQQQQQQAQQQKMLEERQKKQAEIDRRKRLRLAHLKKESIAKKIVKDQLNPLDVGLMSTPFGIVWGLAKIPKWIGKILP